MHLGRSGKKSKDFRNKRVLITGSGGFIGCHLTRRLLNEGAEIHLFLKQNTDKSRIKDLLGNITIWDGDLRDYSSVSSCLRNSSPQIIFHLAALLDVRRDSELIEPLIDINIRGSLNLLRGVIKNNLSLEYFINTGTSEEYGNGSVPFREDQREKPVSPYSASKVAVSYFCQMLHRSMNIPVVTLRPFLTYGPAQSTDMFLPSLIHHCIEGKDYAMTKGDQTREFNFIDDVIEAYLLAAQSPQARGEIINVGNGIEYKIRDVAKKIVDMMGNPIKLLIGALPKRPGESEHFFCDNEKARNILGWAPKVSLEEGLKRTIRWYGNFYESLKK